MAEEDEELSELARGREADDPGGAGGGGAGGRRLHPGEIVAAAARAGYRGWRRILGVAFVVSLVSSGLEIVADHYVDPADAVLSVGATIASTAIAMIGTVLLSGIVCRLAGVGERGRESLAFPRLARTLPWGRLIAADLLFSLAAVIGLLLFIVPGLIAVTLFAVSGPVIEIESRRVFDAMRRSARLARRHFWTVFLLATIPLLASGELEAMAPDPRRAGEIAEFLVIRVLAEAVVEACIALVLVELAAQLIGTHRRPGTGLPDRGNEQSTDYDK